MSNTIHGTNKKWFMKRRGITAFILFGTVGFGIGGAIGGTITSDSSTFLGFATLGIFGGASLGFVSKGWKGAILLALAGGAGFVVGTFMSVIIGMGLGLALPKNIKEIYGLVAPFIMGAIIGGIGALSLGLVLGKLRGALLLSLAGAIGFGVAAQINQNLFLELLTTQALSMLVPLAIWGVIGGTFLGAALGYLEKIRGHRESTQPG